MVYLTYGEEWKKEVSKLPKPELIEMAAKLGKEKEDAEARLLKLVTGCDIAKLQEKVDKIFLNPIFDSNFQEFIKNNITNITRDKYDLRRKNTMVHRSAQKHQPFLR